ncbi:TlpA disulfide reductase family protein [Spirochaeta lutea]|uniref:TlpA disulfide reductase family protein n=1 Tax=Spirochaeta lutea TaxID=1480694 RepID=UPI00068BAEB6|nr:TlpA disulfide reductase family protein [Spirochaeta lutea]
MVDTRCNNASLCIPGFQRPQKNLRGNTITKGILTGLLAVFLLSMGTGTVAAQDNPLPEEVRKAIEGLAMIPFDEYIESVHFELPDLADGMISLEDFRGSFVLLNFWASWCGPCRAEMPSMQALYDDLQGDGLEILAVNQRESQSIAQDFISEFGYSFPVALDANGVIGYQYGVRSIPLTYLVDPEGRIIAGKIGAQDWNTPAIRSAFSTLLN